MPPHSLAFLRPRCPTWMLGAALTALAACGRVGVELLPQPLTVAEGGVAADASDAGPDAAAGESLGMGSGAAIDPCLASCSNNHGSAQCSEGRCILTCARGFTDCDADGRNGCETNIASDPANCGACARSCRLDSELCSDGTCQPSPCAAGRADCDDDPELFCETDLTSSAQNCGFCGNDCSAAHAQTSCRERSCVITTCEPGYADCDASPQNGCEASLSSVNACGMCGRVCPAGDGTPVCNAGACSVACDLTGAYALKLSIPTSWPGTVTVSAGSGEFTFWGLLEVSQSGSVLSGSFTPCGELVPDFSAAPLIGERYGLIFPNALFDRAPLLPGVSAQGNVSATTPGARFSLARTAFLLGANLSDPVGAWPAASAIQALDADGDGKTAVSVPYKTGVGYTLTPVNNFGSFRAETAYLATRAVFSLEGTLNGCTQSSGSVAAQDVDARTLGCRIALGARDCLSSEASHLDQNTPDFRPQAGTYALSKLTSANCPAVRAALP